MNAPGSPPTDSEIQEAVRRIVQGRGRERSACIGILQELQARLGFVPLKALELVAELTEISEAQVYGVATFYSQFRSEPMGRHKISVCMGTACHVRGAGRVLEALEDELGVSKGGTTGDGRFTLESVRCLGACALAPLVVVDGDYHGAVTPRKIKRILGRYE